MEVFTFLLVFAILRLSLSCLPRLEQKLLKAEEKILPIKGSKEFSDAENAGIQANSMQLVHKFYGQRLKNEACHMCPPFMPECTNLEAGVEHCMIPQIRYTNNGHCLYAEIACSEGGTPAVQGQTVDKIRLDDPIATLNEDDKKHETYGILQLPEHAVNLVDGDKHVTVYCMMDKRWYYRSHRPPNSIIRVDKFHCT